MKKQFRHHLFKEQVKMVVYKQDVITHQPAQTIKTQSPEKPTKTSTPPPTITPTYGARDTRKEPLSRLRKTLMTRLVDSQQTTASLTTFNEIDMQAVMNIRKAHKDAFKEKYNVGLGFMSFFTKAVTIALQEWPLVNAMIEGDQILYHDYCDIGIAVSTPKGLVVPVVRNAENMSFAEIEAAIRGYALKGRDGN